MNEKSKLSIELKDNPQDILKYLQFGINIPVLKEFHKYILSDLNNFHTISIVLKEDEEVIGHTLIYDDEKNILYFGFFRIKDHNEKYIRVLLNFVIKYAKEHHFKYIRGPINIPTFIYGWGFMEDGSLKSSFITKPVNPPVYQEIFLQNGFYVKSKQETWEGTMPLFSDEDIENYDFREYEIYQPKDWNEILSHKMTILLLSAQNLSSESQVTPNPQDFFDNIFRFVKNYGDLFMLNLIKYKPTGKFVGCFISLPNPLRKNNEGKLDSIIVYSITINKEHRRKGLSMLVFKDFLEKAYKKQIRYLSAPIEINSIKAKNIVINKGNLSHTRTHLILEYHP